MHTTAVLIFASLKHSSNKFSPVPFGIARKIFSSFTCRAVTISRLVFGENVFLAVPPEESLEFETAQVPLVLQTGETFGERLCHSIQEVFARGYERVLVLGNDCPQLDVPLLRDAQTRFSQADIILGPDHKGGVYLLGFSRDHFHILSNIRWNANTDFEQISSLCHQEVRLEILATRHDLDNRNDLKRVLCHVALIGDRSLRLVLRKLQTLQLPEHSQLPIPALPSMFVHIRLTNQLPPPVRVSTC